MAVLSSQADGELSLRIEWGYAMSTIIMDLCSYTRLGLTGYLASRGVRKRDINDAHTVDELAAACDELKPGVVFINEDCFIHDPANSQHIKQIINQHPKTGNGANLLI